MIALLVATVLGSFVGYIYGHNAGWNACDELKVKPTRDLLDRTVQALENLNAAITDAFSRAENE